MKTSIASLWRLVGEGLAVSYRGAPGYEARLSSHSTLVLSGEPVADFNYALIDTGPQAEARLREYGQVIQAQNLPVIVILTAAVANELGPVANELGLQYAGQIPLMVYQPTKVPPENGTYQVEHVHTPSGLGEATEVMCNAFGLPRESGQRAFSAGLLEGPGVDLFVASCDGAVVSAVVTTRAGANVGIWAMATHPDHQRRGAGRALLNHAIAHHYARGGTLYYLLATEAGQPLYASIGFETVAEAAVWVAGHSTQVSGH